MKKACKDLRILLQKRTCFVAGPGIVGLGGPAVTGVDSAPERLGSECALATAGTQLGSQKWISC